MILTTHRMDEAESLCDNIAIMINGRFACYGSPGHLMAQYGQGYTINLQHVIEETIVDNAVKQLMPFMVKESSDVSDVTDRKTGKFIIQTYYNIP